MYGKPTRIGWWWGSSTLCAAAFSSRSPCGKGALGQRQESILNCPVCVRQDESAHTYEACAVNLLADIDDLVAELEARLARFAVLLALQPPVEASYEDDKEAIEWMDQALKDIKATVTGTHIAHRERFRGYR